jgi:hypothetical protein
LLVGEVPERTGERDREQEREQHLHSGEGDTKLVQQLDQLAVEPFVSALVLPPGLIRVAGRHRGSGLPPSRFGNPPVERDTADRRSR